jgi:hypothetical protein
MFLLFGLKVAACVDRPNRPCMRANMKKTVSFLADYDISSFFFGTCSCHSIWGFKIESESFVHLPYLPLAPRIHAILPHSLIVPNCDQLTGGTTAVRSKILKFKIFFKILCIFMEGIFQFFF